MIENEFKFVLNDHEPKIFMDQLLSLGDSRKLEITQGYLTKNNRIRQTIEVGKTTELMFTFKMSVNSKLVEIETGINQSDYDTLWKKVGHVITKTRIKVYHQDLVWEVDFFYTVGKRIECFLVMAELELPDGQVPSEQLPDFIADNLIYRVPKEDTRFVNANMIRPSTIKKLVQELKNVKR